MPFGDCFVIGLIPIPQGFEATFRALASVRGTVARLKWLVGSKWRWNTMQPVTGQDPGGLLAVEDAVDESIQPGSTVKTVSKSPSRIAFDRLRKDRVAVICFSIFVVFILIAIFAPLLAKLEGQDYHTTDFVDLDELGLPKFILNGQHWLGIEPRNGRDLFARWVYGARPSLVVATSVTIISTIVGVVAGLVAGFLGGWVDRILSWIIDFVLSLPYLLFAIAIPAVLLTLFSGGTDSADPNQVSQTALHLTDLRALLLRLGRSGTSDPWPGALAARARVHFGGAGARRADSKDPVQGASAEPASRRSSSAPRWHCRATSPPKPG